ncbi:MAG: ferritin family protein [Nitrospinaceae bacterium]|nr:ferritin family protein [Nitrospinaceae bacterium]
MKKTENITRLKVLEISLMKEADEKRFYTALAKHVADPEVREFLNLMADETTHHEAAIKKLLEGNGTKADSWTNEYTIGDFVKTHFQTDIFPTGDDISKMAPKFKGVQEVLDFALEVEKVAAEFYKLLGEHCKRPSTKMALILLEKIELEHVEKIKSFKKKISEKRISEKESAAWRRTSLR